MNVALPTINGLALCAGIGMLDEGVRLAFGHLGYQYRTVCYVEREAAAAAQLVALMEAGVIDTAPVFSDLTAFDAGRWRGVVDCVTAGFPCQPHSVAGKREGLEDERWIWPSIGQLISDVGAILCLLENVPGLASTGGLDAVAGDLAARGFDQEWGRLSAADVGGSHQRERLFGLGWMANSGRQHGELLERLVRTEHPRSRGEVGHANSAGRSGAGRLRARRRAESGESDSAVAVTGREGLPQSEHGAVHGQRGRIEGGTVAELCGPFAPGPSDPRWSIILERFPGLAPATEPGVRMLADGISMVVDESRTDQLRAIGNGVVPLCAAVAYIQLARRAGIA